jgi:hypothetical protein
MAAILEQQPMQQYCAFRIDRSGKVIGRTDLSCADDTEVKRRTETLRDGDEIQLWQRDRLVTVFETHANHY